MSDNIELQREDTIKKVEEVEQSVLQFIQNISNEHDKARVEYLKFIYSETVDLNKLIFSLNKARLTQKLYSLSDEYVKNGESNFEYTAYTSEEFIKTISELEADIEAALKKIRKLHNEAFDIDDEEEGYQIEIETREKKKQFQKYKTLFESYHKVIVEYASITVDSVPKAEKAEPIMVTKSEPKPEANIETKSSNLSQARVITERNFYNWLISEGNVSETTAKQYISNIRSIENLYQKIFGIRRNFLANVSPAAVESMINGLVRSREYINVNEQRKNSLDSTLKKYSQFIKRFDNTLNTKAERKGYHLQSYSLAPDIKPVDLNNPKDCTYGKPCYLILNERKYSVRSWKDVYVIFLKFLYNNDSCSKILKSLIEKSLRGRRIDFSSNYKTLRVPVSVSDDFFAEANLSATDIIRRIKILMSLCSISDEQLKIFYKAKLENSNNDNNDTVIQNVDNNNNSNIIANNNLASPDLKQDSTSKEYSKVDIEIPEKEKTFQNNIPSAGDIVLNLNDNITEVYDYSDALNKVCEFAINCKPFKMSRIASQFYLNNNRVFYRKAVPIDGYSKLSNGLQVMSISSMTELQAIVDEIKKYCQIKDDMIIITNK